MLNQLIQNSPAFLEMASTKKCLSHVFKIIISQSSEDRTRRLALTLLSRLNLNNRRAQDVVSESSQLRLFKEGGQSAERIINILIQLGTHWEDNRESVADSHSERLLYALSRPDDVIIPLMTREILIKLLDEPDILGKIKEMDSNNVCINRLFACLMNVTTPGLTRSAINFLHKLHEDTELASHLSSAMSAYDVLVYLLFSPYPGMQVKAAEQLSDLGEVSLRSVQEGSFRSECVRRFVELPSAVDEFVREALAGVLLTLGLSEDNLNLIAGSDDCLRQLIDSWSSSVCQSQLFEKVCAHEACRQRIIALDSLIGHCSVLFNDIFTLSQRSSSTLSMLTLLEQQVDQLDRLRSILGQGGFDYLLDILNDLSSLDSGDSELPYLVARVTQLVAKFESLVETNARPLNVFQEAAARASDGEDLDTAEEASMLEGGGASVSLK